MAEPRQATGTPIREVLGFEERLTAIEKELEQIHIRIDVLMLGHLGTETSIDQLCNVLELIDKRMDLLGEAKR